VSNVSQVTPLYYASTAAIRIYFAELLTWFQSTGIIQTTDPGQLVPSTITIPGAGNTLIGYWLFKFADSSIYFKLEFYTGPSSNVYNHQLYLTVGLGSDGAGNITSIGYPRTNITGGANNAFTPGGPALSGLNTYPSWITYRDVDHSFFCAIHKYGGISSGSNFYSCFAFAIEKFSDLDGVPNSNGYVVTTQGLSLGAKCIKRAIRTASPATVFAANTHFALVPGGVTLSASTVSERKIWPHQQPAPESMYSPYMCTIIAQEVPAGVLFRATALGGIQRTFLSVGMAFGSGFADSTSWTVAILWKD
jgi:hypothetical protein